MPSSSEVISAGVNGSPSSVTSTRKSSSVSRPMPPVGFVPTVAVTVGRGGRPVFQVAGTRTTTPACSIAWRSRRKARASRGVQRSGWKISPWSTIAFSHAQCSAARWTGRSSDSRRVLLAAPAYSRRAWPSGRCCGVPCAERPCVKVARKAKGASGSFRFSARWKCTRPTVFQTGLKARSVSCTEVLACASRAVKAVWSATQRPRRTSGVRYSAPVIGGAATTMASRSMSGGGAMAGETDPRASWPGSGLAARSGCAHSAVTNRAAKSRQKPNAGGSGVDTSPAPSCSKPSPWPRANASTRRAAIVASRPGGSGVSASTRWPRGVRTGSRRTGGGSAAGLMSAASYSIPPPDFFRRGRCDRQPCAGGQGSLLGFPDAGECHSQPDGSNPASVIV